MFGRSFREIVAKDALAVFRTPDDNHIVKRSAAEELLTAKDVSEALGVQNTAQNYNSCLATGLFGLAAVNIAHNPWMFGVGLYYGIKAASQVEKSHKIVQRATQLVELDDFAPRKRENSFSVEYNSKLFSSGF